MIWFLFKMIYRLATLGALALLGYLIYAAVTGQKIEAAELTGVEKVQFEDGSTAQLNAAQGWCAKDGTEVGDAMDEDGVGKIKGLGYIFYDNCSDLGQGSEPNFLIMSAFEFSAEHACKGHKQNTYKVNAPAGDANSCIIETKEFDSGYAVSINYPISAAKSLNFIADAQLWKDKHEEILDMIKTTKYVEDPR